MILSPSRGSRINKVKSLAMETLMTMAGKKMEEFPEVNEESAMSLQEKVLEALRESLGRSPLSCEILCGYCRLDTAGDARAGRGHQRVLLAGKGECVIGNPFRALAGKKGGRGGRKRQHQMILQKLAQGNKKKR